ncbi:MAG: hypothetical protein MK291_05910 [Planctomycetes bacterium]|nr:hypothetical protein [Planctomycetota bacterium]
MPRLIAWEILRSGSDAPLRRVSAAAARAELEPRDAGLLRRLVGTEVRRRATLRAILSRLTKGKPNPDLACHLRIGLAQLLFLDRVPDHAAVNETVDAVSRTLGLSKGKYANGVLRSALRMRQEGHVGLPRHDVVGSPWRLREPVFRDPEEHRFLWAEDAFSVPAKLIKGWADRWGEEEAFRVARWFLQEPPLSGRGGEGARAALMEELSAAGCDPVEGTHDRVLLLPAEQTGALLSSDAFLSGRVAVQGEAALRAALLVEASAGESVLDLCAAPGGKTAVLAESGAKVTACDVSEARLALLSEGAERMGHAGSVETALLAHDAPAPDGPFDAVLVDAPCSNTGVLGARPGARWRWGPASKRSLEEVQATLMERGAEVVRPGGRLVWSTCSLEPGENERRVSQFLEAHSGWSLDEEALTLPGVTGGPVDGGYAARLIAPAN